MRRPTGRGIGRRELIRLAAGLVAAVSWSGSDRAAAGSRTVPAPKAKPMTESRMPVLFIGHGSPMNAIEDNPFSRAFQALGRALPTPKAILCVSAHWFVPGIHTTDQPHPPTIHDFGGFPKALFDMQYPAPGDAALGRRVSALIGPSRVTPRSDWGLDHGTWSVLHHMVPKADVPVVQLSLDNRLTPAQHLEVARTLAPLRDEGVLILGSGNATHNLRHAMMGFQRGDTSIPPWAASFDADLAKAAEQHDAPALAKLIDTDAGRMSHPSIDHYLPLIYAAGAAADHDAVSFPVQGWTGSLSMRSIRWG